MTRPLLRRLLACLVATTLLAACGTPGPSPAASPTAMAPGSPTPSVSAAPASGHLTAAAVATSFIDALARGDLAAAEGLEDDTMRAAAPAAQLGTLWQQITAQFGDFVAVGPVDTRAQPPYTIATVSVAFSRATLPLLVTVSGSGLVAGLHLGSPQPASSPSAAASPAAYVDPASFSESEVTVGSAPWALPGTLTMPRGDGPFPAVVLVAGSGPADRDETIGPNKPLRDLAWGLASAGIAVLRYDKRTLVYGARMAALADITVREETTDDAVAAVALLRATPGVDPDRVFLVGHSLGAYLAPRIAARVPHELRGLVLLEAPSTPLPRLILMQAEYLLSLQPSPGPSAEDALATLRAQVATAESPDLSPSTPTSELPLGTPASYWLDLRTYDPLATAAGETIPMLLVQGGRDYQVPPSELGPWRAALAGRTDVTFRTYPDLDHLLFAGSGPSTPAEYTVPDHVSATVVADLAGWIESS